MKDISRFVKNNGPVSFGKVKLPGVYILFLPNRDHTYVGQSFHLGVRIRSHLFISSASTKAALAMPKETRRGQVQTCIVNSETLRILTGAHGITIAKFLVILE